MKKCVTCKESKPLSEFNKKSSAKDGLQNVCKECNRARSKKYYFDNLVKHRQVIKTRVQSERVRQRKMISDYKESNPCSDCGKHYPSYVMDFDHLSDKWRVISSLPGKCSDKRIWEEIAKCDLVCSNCHRVRTHNRMGLGPDGTASSFYLE